MALGFFILYTNGFVACITRISFCVMGYLCHIIIVYMLLYVVYRRVPAFAAAGGISKCVGQGIVIKV